MAGGFSSAWSVNRPYLSIIAKYCVVVFGIWFAATCFIILINSLYVQFVRGRISVFISYHHSMIDEVRILKKEISETHVRVRYLEFQSSPDHDKLLNEIYEAIDQSTYFVCIPGKCASFVEAEVSYAIALKKPVLFVINDENDSIPNTAQKSYPILLLKTVSDCRFELLKLALELMHGKTNRLLAMSFSGISYESPFVKIPLILLMLLIFVFAIFFAAGVIVVFIASAFIETQEFIFLFGSLFAYFLAYIGAILMALFTLTFALGFMKGLFVSNRARSIARRMTQDGTYAYERLLKLFRPIHMLEPLSSALSKIPPKAHHEKNP